MIQTSGILSFIHNSWIFYTLLGILEITSGIQLISTYNYGIINSDVNEAVNKIENIITAEKCRVDRINFEYK